MDSYTFAKQAGYTVHTTDEVARGGAIYVIRDGSGEIAAHRSYSCRSEAWEWAADHAHAYDRGPR